MNLENFHQKLLGKDQERTPKNFKLTEVHKALYSATEEGKRGYRLKTAGTKQDAERFLATFVTALHMTTFPSHDKVIFIVARNLEGWAIEQIRGTVRYIYKSRKKAPAASIQAIDEALGRMDIGSRALQLQGEPDRWVAFGFTSQDLLPPWMRGKLILK